VTTAKGHRVRSARLGDEIMSTTKELELVCVEDYLAGEFYEAVEFTPETE
jgi:hypothetical protein